MNQKIKVRVSNNAFSTEIAIKNFNNLDAEHLTDITSEMAKAASNAAKEVYEKYTQTSLGVISPKKVSEKPKKAVSGVSKPADEFKIRERLPNTIDAKELDIKQAVTENSLIRCPHCGQAHCAVFKDATMYYFMEKNYDTNSFDVICKSEKKEDMELAFANANTDMQDYFADLQNALKSSIENIDIVVDNDSLITCPICSATTSFMNWKEAYDTPLHFFETEQLCDLCGGETVTKMKKKKAVVCCEKCKHEVPVKED